MHTIIVLCGGGALLLACLLLGHAFGSMHGLAWGAKVFIPLWLVVAAINMWIGVTKAGYSLADETPVLLVIFGVPAVVAGLVAWKWS